MKHIVVIGGGISGLASAALLAQSGFTVTLVEKNRDLGGRARVWKHEGFSFDMGPSWYHMPEAFDHFFALFGKRTSDYYELIRLDPQYRVFFPDKKQITVGSDLIANLALFEKLDPGVTPQLAQFLDTAKKQYELARDVVLYKDFDSLTDFLRPEMLASAAQFNLMRTLQGEVERVTSNKYLQKILMFTVLFLGGSPRTTPGMFSMMTHLDLGVGAYYPAGGMGSFIHGLEKLCLEQNVTIFRDWEVKGFEIENTKITGVTNSKGKTLRADIFVSAGDYPFTEQLLPKDLQTHPEQYWRKKELAPSGFVAYLGVKGKLESMVHHNLFLDFNWDDFFHTVFHSDDFPDKPSFYLSCTSKTDPGSAPSGYENVFLTVQCSPETNDSDRKREHYFETILSQVEDWSGEQFRDRIEFSRIFSPRDFKKDYNAFQGTAIGLANIMSQSAYFRPKRRSAKVQNLFYTGQYTHPGVGMPMCLISAELVTNALTKAF